MRARWILPEKPAPGSQTAREIAAIAQALGCPASFATLLHRRGIVSTDMADRFLNPRLKTLSDPFLLPDMAPAVDRILHAIDRRERIVLYGDYDVDGIASLALLTRLLRAYGATPACFLPDRIEEGYGITREGLARCMAEFRPQLLVALDCGSTSAIELAALSGTADAIVVDHHECPSELPRCVAVINPKRSDADENAVEFRRLCTAGLVFKLCHALLKRRPAADFSLREHLDLVALATVADIVPLIGENRLLVQKGLEALECTRLPGLRALMDVAAVKPPLDSSTLGFQLGPRLNAAGRLGTAGDSLNLLLTDDPATAHTLAMGLDAQNRERRKVEAETLRDAEQILGADPAREPAIVCGGTGWHPGVVGIVASRLCRKYHRPALVVGFDDAGLGKGSGRSIAGLSLVEALGRCESLLERFGGHEMAAGVTVRQERFPAFAQQFRETVGALLSTDDLLPRVYLDAELDLKEVMLAFLDIHEKLQPFGMGNAQPVFLARDVRPLSEPAVLKEKHLRLALGSNGSRHEAIFFNGAADPLPRPPWDMAFTIARNEWRGRVSVQIQIQEIRSAQQA